MISHEYNFYLLCIGELCVVFTGFASIPAATGLQVLILLAIFRNLVFSKDAYRPVAFLVSFTIATMFFIGLALSFYHTSIPLLLLAVTATFVVLYLIFIENRLEQRFGGSV
jgi:hypothetical protein